MTELGNAGGIVGGTVALLIALKPYIIPPRTPEQKANGHRSGNIDPAIWRMWIKEDCQEAIKSEFGRVISEMHDKQDAEIESLGAHISAVREFNERQLAIIRDIRAAQQSIESKLTALLDRKR